VVDQGAERDTVGVQVEDHPDAFAGLGDLVGVLGKTKPREFSFSFIIFITKYGVYFWMHQKHTHSRVSPNTTHCCLENKCHFI